MSRRYDLRKLAFRAVDGNQEAAATAMSKDEWLTMWRSARVASRKHRAAPSMSGHKNQSPAATCLASRAYDDVVWPHLDPLLFKAWRIHRGALSGLSLPWSRFKQDHRERAMAMQALAAARRGNTPMETAVLNAVGILTRWRTKLTSGQL